MWSSIVFKAFDNNAVEEVIEYVKEQNADDSIFGIYIEEYSPLFYNVINNKLVLEGKKQVLLEETFNDIPILINSVSDEVIYTKLMDKFVKINDDIKQKISEIKYDPNDVDKERFLFTMNDGNYVYITLTKIEEVNYYMDILPTLENKKGILYLDSGKYFKIFE